MSLSRDHCQYSSSVRTPSTHSLSTRRLKFSLCCAIFTLHLYYFRPLAITSRVPQTSYLGILVYLRAPHSSTQLHHSLLTKRDERFSTKDENSPGNSFCRLLVTSPGPRARARMLRTIFDCGGDDHWFFSLKQPGIRSGNARQRSFAARFLPYRHFYKV